MAPSVAERQRLVMSGQGTRATYSVNYDGCMQWETWVWDDAGKASAVANGVTFAEVATAMQRGATARAIRDLGSELAILGAAVGLGRYLAVTVKKLDRHSPVAHVIAAQPITVAQFRSIQEG